MQQCIQSTCTNSPNPFSKERYAERKQEVLSSLPWSFLSSKICGGYSGGVPPLPIPNREVKPVIADGSALSGVRVGSCRFSTRTSDTGCPGFLFVTSSISVLCCSLFGLLFSSSHQDYFISLYYFTVCRMSLCPNLFSLSRYYSYTFH